MGCFYFIDRWGLIKKGNPDKIHPVKGLDHYYYSLGNRAMRKIKVEMLVAIYTTFVILTIDSDSISD